MSYSKGMSAQVLQYFTEHAGLTVYVNDIMEETGLSTQQVASAINYLMSAKKEPITRVVSGAYRYQPKPKDDHSKRNGRLLCEIVGETKEGKLILQHEDGRLIIGDFL